MLPSNGYQKKLNGEECDLARECMSNTCGELELENNDKTAGKYNCI